MSLDAAPGGRIEAAAKRLEQAVAVLEQRLKLKLAEAGALAGSELAQDRARLAMDLDEARGRMRQLSEAGVACSEILARAISEITGILNQRGS